MKIEEFSQGKTDREILTAMVVDRAVLGSVTAKWDGKLFPSQWANRVAGWCVRHYQDYRKAPGRAVGSYFERWAERAGDVEDVTRTEEFLAYLSGQYDRNGSGPDARYLIDLAAKRFTAVRLKTYAERVMALADDDVDKAEQLYHEYRKVDVGGSRGISLFEDGAAVERAFESRGETLIEFGQPALDRFFSGILARDEFVCFFGMEKVGKSYVLQRVATQAVRCGRRVAFFEMGDQSQDQIIRRFGAFYAKHPFKLQDALPVRYPATIQPPQGRDVPEVTYEELRFDAPLTTADAKRAIRRAGKAHGRDLLKLSCHAADSTSVLGIESILDDWERDGWRPDVVVIDYLDLLAPLNGKAETRDQINATWKACRGLNLKKHCLLVAATQADAASYDAEVLTRSNFSEDKRKNAHVTGMCGITQRPEEKERGLVRLNWPLARDLDFREDKCVYCAGSMAVADPFVLSTF